MSSEPEMSDAQFTNVFSVMIGGLILLTIALIILAAIIGSGVKQSSINEQARDSQAAERIEPAGQITVGEVAPSEPGGAGGEGATEVESGETVYQNNCAACHATGVAGAPTFGESAAWSDRIAKGKDTLYQNAIEGFQGDAGVMPPKGGNTSLSDEAVQAAVDHMVNAASGSAGAEAGAPESTAESAASETAPSEPAASDTAAAEPAAPESTASGESAATDAPSGETVYQNSCVACHGTGVAGAPKLGDSAAWSDRIPKGMDTLYQHAIQGFQGDTGMMPPKGGNMSLSDAAVQAAVDYMVEQAQ